MDPFQLQELANRHRFMKEAGITLVLCSSVLGIFLLMPSSAPHQTAAAADAVTIATTTVPDTFANIAINAKAGIVYDLTNGKTLYEKNADAQLPLASLTKLLTVYAAVSGLGEDATVTVPADALQVGSPRMLREGQVWKVRDLARITLTGSLNDGATALAEAAAGARNITVPALLVETASALHLSQTYAVNGSGLDVNANVSGGYGSARDMAILAGALTAAAPDIASATTDGDVSATSLGGTTLKVANTNPGVSYAPHLLLSKTGLTDLAGGNLVLVFDAGIGHPIAVVVMGSTEKERFTDADSLVAATLARFADVASL